MANSSAPDAAATNSPASVLPLFYRSVAPLDSARHADKTVKPTHDFSFAKATNAVPLHAAEYSQALRHYPIVFSASEPVVSLAVLGVQQDENLFVGTDGRWREGTYIPAYVRRYPFLFLTSSDPDKFILGIDETAPHFADADGAPLFVSGQPSEQVKHALGFCSEFQAHIKLTQDFCRAVKDAGLLVDQNAVFEFKSGQRATVQGFQIVDEAKFKALPDDVILAWRKSGYLPLVFAHLFSMQSWAALLDLAAQR